MIVNGEVLRATTVSFRTEFHKAFDLATTDVDLYAMTVPSSKGDNVYKWLGAMPEMREWIGDAVFEDLDAYEWTIKNKDWQIGLSVDRNDIEDEALGLISASIAELGESAKRHPGKLVVDLLNGGFTAKCYDGQFYFDTDHKDGDGPVQSNKGTGVLNAANFLAAMVAFMRLKNQRGEPLNLMPDTLVVPPELQATAEGIVQVKTLANGADNPNYNKVRIKVEPRLTSTTAWFLLCTTKRLKPFIYQPRRAATFVALDEPTDEKAATQKKFRYSTEGRWNAGYGLWQLAWGSDGTVP